MEICLILFFVIPNNMCVYVYMYDRSVPVYWGTYSIVEAELACLADLLAVPGWMYAVNLAGSEVVLATNRSRTLFWVISNLSRELVMDLMSGPNSAIYTISRPLPPSEQWRIENKFSPVADLRGYDPESNCK